MPNADSLPRRIQKVLKLYCTLTIEITYKVYYKRRAKQQEKTGLVLVLIKHIQYFTEFYENKRAKKKEGQERHEGKFTRRREAGDDANGSKERREAGAIYTYKLI